MGVLDYHTKTTTDKLDGYFKKVLQKGKIFFPFDCIWKLMRHYYMDHYQCLQNNLHPVTTQLHDFMIYRCYIMVFH